MKKLRRGKVQERATTALKGNFEMRKYATYFLESPKPKLPHQTGRATPCKARIENVAGESNAITVAGNSRNTFKRRHASIKIEHVRKKAATSPIKHFGDFAKS